MRAGPSGHTAAERTETRVLAQTPPSMGRPAPIESRFWCKVERGEASECWLWTARLNTHGYGSFWMPGGPQGAHRVAYELTVGPVPAGLHLDHLCRDRRCVNPLHLQPVTAKENILRGISPTALNAAKTHCYQGHEFTPENTYIMSSGGRRCRICKRDEAKRYYYHKSRRAA